MSNGVGQDDPGGADIGLDEPNSPSPSSPGDPDESLEDPTGFSPSIADPRDFDGLFAFVDLNRPKWSTSNEHSGVFFGIVGVGLGLTGLTTAAGVIGFGVSALGLADGLSSAHNNDESTDSVDLSTGDNTTNNFVGSGRTDLFFGFGEADVILAGAGNDFVEGGSGSDILDGGSGFDAVVYSLSLSAVTVRFDNGSVYGGDAEGDSISNFEGIVGSSFDDHLRLGEEWGSISGGSGNDLIFGSSGDDVLSGDAGADTLYGLDGEDVASYSGSDAGVTIRFDNGSVYGGHASGDTLYSIETIIGSDFDDHLRASDVEGLNLFGLDGDDLLVGGSTDNFFEGGDGADEIIGGDGSDTATYAASDAGVTVRFDNGSIYGGHAQGDTLSDIENLYGSNFDDYLRLTSSADGKLKGQDGNDLLYGADGDDWLEGGLGGDVLSGSAGTDTASYVNSDAAVTVRLDNGSIYGGHAQGDTLASIERIVGSVHDDYLALGAEAGFLDGRAGNDLLLGSSGDDRLIGRSGVDDIRGNQGVDIIDTGEDDDFIHGGAGDDWLYGGLGDDTYYFGRGDGFDRIVEGNSISSGGGSDLIVFEGNIDPQDVYVRLESSDMILYVADSGQSYIDATDIIRINGWADLENQVEYLHFEYNSTTYDIRSAHQITQSDGDDHLAISASIELDVSLIIRGGDGDDQIFGENGRDQLFGLAGDDVIRGSLGDDAIYGGTGHDILSGDEDDDYIEGNAGDDSVYGNQGDDLLYGGTGADTIGGWTGHDVISGEAGDDFLLGQDGDDTIDGGIGDDDIYGHAGIDVAYGFDGADWIDGGEDNDQLYGGLGDDVLKGREGNDHLEGGAGTDNLFGGDGDDTLIVGDTGGGWQFMRGEGGNDTYHYAKASGQTMINHQEAVGQGVDDRVILQDLAISEISFGTIDYGSGNLNGVALRLLWNDGAGSGELRLANMGDAIESIEFADGAMLSSISIDAGTGQTTLFAADGGVNLLSGAGSQSVVGGNEDDRLGGGSGQDDLTGGLGADTFVMESGFEGERVLDFDVNLDQLDLTAMGLADFAEFQNHATDNGSGSLVVDFGSGDILTIVGVTEAELQQSSIVL